LAQEPPRLEAPPPVDPGSRTRRPEGQRRLVQRLALSAPFTSILALLRVPVGAMAVRRLVPAREVLFLATALLWPAACQGQSQADVAGAEVAEQVKNQKRQELLNQISSALAEFSSAEDRLKKLESDNSQKAAALTERETITAGLERTVGELRNQVREKEDANTALWKEYNDLHSKHNALWAEFGDLQAKYKQLEAAQQRLEMTYSDPSVKDFLEKEATKVRQHASSETFKYVLPHSSRQGSKLALRDTFSYGSVEEASSWGPAQGGSVVYGLAVVPLVCSACCLARVVWSLSPCLMFLHLYLAGFALCSALVAGCTRVDPMDALALHDPSVYVFAQACFGVFLAAHTLLVAYPLVMWVRRVDWHGAAKKVDWNNRDFSEALKSIHWSDCAEIVSCRAGQLVLVFPLAVNYVSYAWWPAMSNRSPQVGQMAFRLAGFMMGWSALCIPYVVASAAYFAVFRLEQKLWRASSPNGDSSVMSICVSADAELRFHEIGATFRAARFVDVFGSLFQDRPR